MPWPVACNPSLGLIKTVTGGTCPHRSGNSVAGCCSWDVVVVGSTTRVQAGQGLPGGVASICTTIGSRCPQWAISTPMGWLPCSVTACAWKSSGDSAQPTAAGFTGGGAGAGPGRGADVGPDRSGGG